MLATWGCTTFPKPTLDLELAGATSLDSRITFTRGSKAWYFNSSGVLTEAANDVARFDYDPSTLAARGLLIEEARTNSIRNNTMQGAVAGTPGTLPTNWSTFTGLTGLTQAIIGTGSDNGITYIDIRLSGTPSAAGQWQVAFDTTTGIVASSGQAWTSSVYYKLVAGSLTGINSTQISVNEYTAAGGYLDGTFTTITAPSSTMQRASTSRTFTNASTARVYSPLFLNLSGAAIDFTLRIGLPQLELGAFATSVIPTTTTALTRNADVASMTGTNFSSWYNAVEGTLLVNFASVGAMIANRAVVSVNDGTTGNYVAIGTRNGSAVYGSTLRAASGTVYQIGSFGASDTAAKKAIIGFKNLDQGVTFSGAAVATDTQTIPTVNQLTIGTGTSSSASTVQASNWIQRISYYPSRLPNSTLQALTA